MLWRDFNFCPQKEETNLPYFFLRKNEDPQHCSSPPAMIAIRSPSRSASSMKWVVRSVVRPCFSAWSRSHNARLAAGSKPDVGSSNITICELVRTNYSPISWLRLLLSVKYNITYNYISGIALLTLTILCLLLQKFHFALFKHNAKTECIMGVRVFVCEHMCKQPTISINTKVLNIQHHSFRTVFAIYTFKNTH